ncbi:MAG: GAF domain-containing protein [Thermomicrobiales bacterium]
MFSKIPIAGISPMKLDSGEYREETRKPIIPLPEKIVGRVVRGGEPIWLERLTEHPDFRRRWYAGQVGLKFDLFVPLLVDQQVVGVIEFFTDAELEPDATTLETMKQLALLVGRVVERDPGAAQAGHRIAQLEDQLPREHYLPASTRR